MIQMTFADSILISCYHSINRLTTTRTMQSRSKLCVNLSIIFPLLGTYKPPYRQHGCIANISAKGQIKKQKGGLFYILQINPQEYYSVQLSYHFIRNLSLQDTTALRGVLNIQRYLNRAENNGHWRASWHFGIIYQSNALLWPNNSTC